MRKRIRAVPAWLPVVLAASIGASCVVERIVSVVPVNAVEIDPPLATLGVGETMTLQVTLRDRFGNELGNREVTWISTAPHIASVDENGVVTAVSVGIAGIQARSEGRQNQANITVIGETSIAVDKNQVQLQGTAGSSTPSVATVNVTNGGSGQLTGLSASVTYSGSASGWLFATLNTTTAPAVLTLVGDAGSLAAGSYSASVLIQSPVASNTATVEVQFTVNPGEVTPNPVPQVTSVTPSEGRRGHTLPVTIAGTGFIQGATSVSFGPGIAVQNLTVQSATSMTATLVIEASATLGPRDVVVSNPAPGGGIGTLAGGFTVLPPFPVPAIVSVTPSSGSQGQTLDVSVLGNNFGNGTQLDFGPGITVTSVEVESQTELTATIVIDSNAAVGPRDVTVTNPAPGGGSATLTGGFTVTAANPVPTVTFISPAAGVRGQTIEVEIIGTGFIGGGVTTVSFGPDIAVLVKEIPSSTRIIADVIIGSGAAIGPRNVTVTNPAPGGGSATLTDGFTVLDAYPVPMLASVNPDNASRGETLDVVLTGAGFLVGVTNADFGPGITVNSVTVTSPTSLTANITVTNAADIGPRAVAVSNPAPGGAVHALPDAFTVLAPQPTITGVNPTQGQRGQAHTITVTGTGFMSSPTATTVSFGAGITVNSVTVQSSTSILANITIDAGAALGPRDVTVTNAGPGGGSDELEGGFTVVDNNNPMPTLVGVEPDIGVRGETLNVVVTGSNFAPGVTTTPDFGPNITVNTYNVLTPSQLTANITIGYDAALGPRDVVVTNSPPGGGPATLTNGFNVHNPAPTLASVSPTSGAQGVSLPVAITGSGFIDGETAVRFQSGMVGFVEGLPAIVDMDGIAVDSIEVHRPDSLTAYITIAPDAAPGPRIVIAENPAPGGGESAPLGGAFSVVEANPEPTLSSISPTSGVQGADDLEVELTGSGFVAGVTQVSFGDGITVTNVNVTLPTTLIVTIDIDAGATPGTRDVTVTNPEPGGGSASLEDAFTVTALNPEPTLSAISPDAGVRGATDLDVTLTGTGFVDGVTEVSFGDGITVKEVTVTSPNELTVTIDIALEAETGARNVTVTNPGPGGGSDTLEAAFTVRNPAPTITNISPPEGAQGATDLEVTLTGTGFIDGVTSVTIEGQDVDITVKNVVVEPTTITLIIDIAEDAELGNRLVTVTNAAPGGGSDDETFEVVAGI